MGSYELEMEKGHSSTESCSWQNRGNSHCRVVHGYKLMLLITLTKSWGRKPHCLWDLQHNMVLS